MMKINNPTYEAVNPIRSSEELKCKPLSLCSSFKKCRLNLMGKNIA